jgi:hypothetical protein
MKKATNDSVTGLQWCLLEHLDFAVDEFLITLLIKVEIAFKDKRTQFETLPNRCLKNNANQTNHFNYLGSTISSGGNI